MKKNLNQKELTQLATLLRAMFPRRFKLIVQPNSDVIIERAPVGRPKKQAVVIDLRNWQPVVKIA